jgi:hypothetical protein
MHVPEHARKFPSTFFEDVTVPMRIQGTRVNSPSMFREHVCHVPACSANTLGEFLSVFSETFANYEAFCSMRIKMVKDEY